MSKYISREQESELLLINQFYTALKAKMTGQVINGVLVGCLLESELKEVYEQYRQSITNSTQESDDEKDS